MAYKSQPTVTRPADTTAYTAGDVVGGVIPFDGMRGAGSLLLTAASLRIHVAAIPAGMTSFRLHLYDKSPPSALADNAAWTLAGADRDDYLGFVDVGSPAAQAGTLFAQVDGLNKHVISDTNSGLFGYLVTNGAFTPAGNSEVYVPALFATDI